MPRYTKGKGKLQRKRKWKGFADVHHMTKWLTRTSHEDPIWKKHFQQAAQNHKGDKPFFHPRSLRAVATKTPVKLAGDVLSELKMVHKGQDVGGGISELLHWLGAAAVQQTGFNSFREWIGAGYEHKKLPHESQVFAKAVSATYYKMGSRPDEVENLVRLPEYDSDRMSVWKQPNGQLLVTLHGTKMSWGDAKEDASIAALGNPQSSEPLQELLNKFDEQGITYDLAGHSLSTQYIINSTHKNVDKIYLFNAASSPLMDSKYLDKIANDTEYTQFINPSDALTQSTWQKMSDETVNNSYVAPYTYSPFAAHSITQWYKDLDEPEFKESVAEDG